MVDVIDMLQCPLCGNFYKPEATVSGRVVDHCLMPVNHGLSRGQLIEVKWLRGEVHIDWAAAEARAIQAWVDDVELTILTGLIVDTEV